MRSRWTFIVALAILVPITVGCGSKAEEKPVVSHVPVNATKPRSEPAKVAPLTSTDNLADVQKLTPNASGKWVDVKLDMAQLKQRQEGEKQGHLPSLLLPEEVARDFVSRTTELADYKGSFIETKLFHTDGVMEAITGQKVVFLHMTQPVTQGQWGIWAVDKYQMGR